LNLFNQENERFIYKLDLIRNEGDNMASDELVFDKKIETLFKEVDKIIDIRSIKKSNDLTVNSKLKYSYNFSKLYLYIVSSIRRKIVMFTADGLVEATDVIKKEVYKHLKFLIDLGEMKRNRNSSVFSYVVSKPIDKFLTEERLRLAIDTVKGEKD